MIQGSVEQKEKNKKQKTKKTTPSTATKKQNKTGKIIKRKGQNSFGVKRMKTIDFCGEMGEKNAFIRTYKEINWSKNILKNKG